MGTVSRDGAILSAPVLTQEVRSRMLDAIVAAFLDQHPEAVREAIDQMQKSDRLPGAAVSA